MIEVQFTKDHGRFTKGDRRWYDDNSADHLVKAKVARRVNHTDSPRSGDGRSSDGRRT